MVSGNEKPVLSKAIILIVILITLGLCNSAFTQTLQPNDQAPTFFLKSLGGDNVYLRDYCGELRSGADTPHVVILSFFATWCLPCQHEIPILEKFYNEFKGEPIKVFLIDVGEDSTKVVQYVSAKGITLPVLLDNYTTTAKNYGVVTNGNAELPQLFIIDQQGRITYHKLGYSQDDQLRKTLIQHVGELLNQ